MPEIHEIKPTVNASERTLRVAAYCRVSSDSEDQLNSFAAQVKHYTTLISGNSAWELIDIYADEAITGTRADTRPDFQRLLRDCRRGKIDKILAKSISRFSRNIKDSLTSIRELKTLGVEIFFEREHLDTSEITSEMLIGFYGTLAQEESVSISGNMRISYQNRMKRGEFITCRAPYGYRLANGCDLVIDEDEAPIVRQIFAEYLSGRAMRDIAAALAEEGVPKRHGHWVESAVRRLLQNEKYAGNALLQKRYTTNTLPFRKVENKGERDQYYIENSHPAIINPADFEQAQALMRERSSYPGPPAQQYPFSRKIICGVCGRSFKQRVCRGKTYWVCRGHNTHNDVCPAKQIPEPLLEAAFVRLWNKLRAHRYDILYPMLNQLENLKTLASKRNTKLYEIDVRIDGFAQQNHMLNLLRSQGYVDAVIFMEKSNEINAAISALRRERRRLAEGEDDDFIGATKCLIETLESGPQTMQGFDADCFESIVDKIIAVSQTEVRFRLINGLELTEAVERIGRWTA